jgi:hypothetical protein
VDSVIGTRKAFVYLTVAVVVELIAQLLARKARTITGSGLPDEVPAWAMAFAEVSVLAQTVAGQLIGASTTGHVRGVARTAQALTREAAFTADAAFTGGRGRA